MLAVEFRAWWEGFLEEVCAACYGAEASGSQRGAGGGAREEAEHCVVVILKMAQGNCYAMLSTEFG
jgi:hypothetical protein